MRNPERGLSAFGLLLLLAIAVAIGYYAFRGITGVGEAPTCKGEYGECLRICRRTETENAGMQACLQKCATERDACERKG